MFFDCIPVSLQFVSHVSNGAALVDQVQSQLQIMELTNLGFEVGEVVVIPVVRDKPLGFQRL